MVLYCDIQGGFAQGVGALDADPCMVKPITVFLVTLASLVSVGVAGAQTVVINEVMASNTATLADPQGQFDDWVEIYNPGTQAVDLAGLYLTDDLSEPTRWPFPKDRPAETVIQAKGFLLVWLDKDSEDVPGLHAEFELNAQADTIALFAADGWTCLDQVQLILQRPDITWGRSPDGSGPATCLLTPTPLKPNAQAFSGLVADVQFSHDRGFYDQPFYLQLVTATPGATIRYTLDASAPTPGTGLVYTGPIPIQTTAVVRAMATKPGSLDSLRQTYTFLFLKDVIRQPIDVPGYPRPWTWLGGSSYAYHDYEMDPQVVNAPAYKDVILDALRAIPTLSVAISQQHLNETYWYGDGLDNGPERPASMELIYPSEPNKNTQAECTIEPHSHNRMKRSLRMNFRANLGDAKLASSLLRDAPLNGDGATDQIDRLVLRAGNNRSWARVWNANRTLYTEDQWLRDSQIALSGVGSRGAFVHLYINGLYWGLYNPVERPDAVFAATYLGGEEEDWFSVSHNGVHNGGSTRWNYLIGPLMAKDMTVAANYAEVQKYLDLDRFIDYLALSWFIGMTDWPSNNWWAAMRTDVPGPAMFFSWDGEWSWLTTRGHNNGWVHPDFRSAKSGGHFIPGLWHSLRRNPDFLRRFADRMYSHLFNDGPLTDARCKARQVTLDDSIRQAVVAESARWGDTCEPLGQPTRTRDVDWIATENEMLGPGFMTGNGTKFVAALRAEGYYPAIDPPIFQDPNNHLATGAQVTLINPNTRGQIAYTLDGTDPRLGGQSPTQGQIVTLVPEDATKGALAYTGPVSLSRSSVLKARVQDGTTWSALNQKTFSVGTVAESLRITEIQYHPADSGTEFVELRNIGQTSVNLNLVRFTSGIRFAFGDLWLSPGQLTLVVQDTQAFEARYGQDLPVAGPYEGSLDNGGERLRLEDAAGTAILDFEYSDSWFKTTDGGGFSLTVVDPVHTAATLWDAQATWRASQASGGSPGRDD